MPAVPIPIASPDPIDLITGSYSTSVLSAGGITLTAAQAAVQASLITAASREIIRYCGNRAFALASYVEVVSPEGSRLDRGEPATAKLSRFPVVSITRCATGRTPALTVLNTSAANQEATVTFDCGGDPEFDNLVPKGLTLARTASGTQTSATVSWTTTTPYTTIVAVADSINALGGGWSATTNTGGRPDLSLLPAAYLAGVREPGGALATAGVSLDVFATPYRDYTIERSTGILRCLGLDWPGFRGFDDWGERAGAFGWPQVEVRYTAGFATVPESLQVCCAEVVQLMYARLAQDPSLKSETAGNYAWVARDALSNLSDASRFTLDYYKDHWL